jgi:hypothetical protein
MRENSCPMNTKTKFCVVYCRVSDPYSFFPDPDPDRDPAFEAADQSGSGSGFIERYCVTRYIWFLKLNKYCRAVSRSWFEFFPSATYKKNKNKSFGRRENLFLCKIKNEHLKIKY